MMKTHIDQGQSFDFGRTSDDYAKFRDLYPEEFYKHITQLGLCVKGQDVLDLGTGTGVLPRNLYRFGARFTAADISDNQIREAKRLSANKQQNISYLVSSAEDISFPDNSFDVITACQCFTYFDKAVIVPKMQKMLRPGGHFAELFLAWLPAEDEIADSSEKLILKYNPNWNGCGYSRLPIATPTWAESYFRVEQKIAFDIPVHFTKESWMGRIRACRGVGASLSDEMVTAFDKEHSRLLDKIAPSEFDILHYATMLICEVIK